MQAGKLILGVFSSVLLSFVLLAARAEGEVALPKPLGEVKHPADNAPTPTKLALGRALFFDPRLSRTGKVSCTTCHDPEKGFSNGSHFAVGVDGKQSKRNVPGLVNVGHSTSLFWDGRAATLEEQALSVLANPAEMDMKPAALADRLNALDAYRKQFAEAFGGKATPERITLALAAYQRSLVSSDTPFDRYLRGDRRALSEPALRGMRLFFGEARCEVCHKGPNLSDGHFHNIGTADAKEVGRRGVTKKERDHGAFRTPQMREVSRTAPYMHNGKFKALAEVVRHYNFGGVTDAENEHRDEELRVLYLNEEQTADLVAFLSEGLTSETKKPTRDADKLNPVSGVYQAEEVKGSPRLTASGIAWWKDRLIIADRGTKKLRTCTPPDRFGEFKTLTRPVGVAVDPDGHLIVTEKETDVLSRVARFKQNGGEETLVGSTADAKKQPDGPGTPHFVAVHPNGTIYWSGFPDGGTRYLLPGAKKVSIAQPGIVHTYGIGLSPKHDWLYVNSKIPNPDRRGVWRFPVDRDGSLGRGEFFIQIDRFETTHLKDLPKAKDGSDNLKGWVGRLLGLAVDRLGYIYVGGAESHTSGSAVAVFTPGGKKLAAMIVGVPRNISGLAFGSTDGRTLFITGAGEYRLFQVRLPVPGEVFRDGKR